MLQVNHVDQLFEEIEKLKRNNWEVRLRFDKFNCGSLGLIFCSLLVISRSNGFVTCTTRCEAGETAWSKDGEEYHK